MWHLEWAREIASGKLIGDGAYFRGPFYPYLLAFFLKITDSSIFWARFLQIFIASASAVFVYLMGRDYFSRRIGIAAALAYSLYGPLIFYETMFLIPVVFIFLNLLSIYLLLHYKKQKNWRIWFLAGIVFGLAAISRPNVLVLVPFLLIWLYFIFSELKNFIQKIKIPLIYLVGILIPVFAVSLRNYAVTGEPAVSYTHLRAHET